MSVFKSAYETTACNGYLTNKLAGEIEKAMINVVLFPMDSGNELIPVNPNVMAVKSSGPDVASIPTFVHPITLEVKGRNEPATFCDVRSCTSYVQQQGSTVISNSFEYNFSNLRAHLTHLWQDCDREVFLNVSRAPMSLYARWMSENITRRFGLDPADQLTIAILASYFYVCLFYDDTEFTDHDKIKIASLIGKANNCGTEMVLDIITPLKAIVDLADFIEVIKDVTGNIRLNELNVGLLFGVIGGGWYGIAGRELLCVAAEHPPTWFAIVQAAYNDRSYKNTSIGKLAARDKLDVVKTFTHGLFNLVRN